MENDKRLYIISFIFFTILGGLLHFAFDFANGNLFVGLFTPVNESVWEHFKLVLVPLTLFALLILFLKKDTLNNIMFATSFSVILSNIFIYIIFTLYETLGFPESVISSITIYTLGMAFGFLLIYFFSHSTNFANTNIIGTILIFLIYISFMTTTFYPPQLEIFRDKVTNTYGILKSRV